MNSQSLPMESHMLTAVSSLKSESVMEINVNSRDICICNERVFCKHSQHNSVSVIGSNCPQEKKALYVIFGYYST